MGRTIRIDECDDRWWRFGAYETRSILGIKYEHRLFVGDDLEEMQSRAQEVLKLPIYVRAAA
jgi:hypothetical protein